MIKVDGEELHISGDMGVIVSELAALNVHIVNALSKQYKIPKKLLKDKIKKLTKVYKLTDKGMSLADATAEAKIDMDSIQGVYGNPPDTLLDETNKDLRKDFPISSSKKPEEDNWDKIWNT